MALRIPTGRMPKNTARTLTLILGVTALGLSFVPALSAIPGLREFGLAATGLGTTLGRQ